MPRELVSDSRVSSMFSPFFGRQSTYPNVYGATIIALTDWQCFTVLYRSFDLGRISSRYLHSRLNGLARFWKHSRPVIQAAALHSGSLVSFMSSPVRLFQWPILPLPLSAEKLVHSKSQNIRWECNQKVWSHDTSVVQQPFYHIISSPAFEKQKAKTSTHTTAGIRWWSPTQLLINRSQVCVWQSGRDAQYSWVYGRMWVKRLLIPII